jgi:two-component system KDP operon response regulator KdpE
MSERRARVLVVEDEADIRRFVRMALESAGHEVFEADGMARGLIEAGSRRPDLAVLDLGLPDGDGVTLIQDLRQWTTMPVIVLSARSSELEKIEALDAGADDFLVKPFGAGELLARVRAQLRRQAHPGATAEPLIQFGDVVIDLVKRSVVRQGRPVHLTPIEYRLLTYLVSQRDRVITHGQLVKAVWGPGHLEDKHYVRVHMANLRKKVEDNPSMPKHLITEAGVGYRFTIAQAEEA